MKLKARFYESAIYLGTRPGEYLLSRAMRYSKVAYLPFVKTYFINDPIIAKQALKDVDNFSSAHTGSVGQLASFIMGFDSKALFNMSGEDHKDLKFKLLSIFQPEYIDEMIKEALGYEIDWLKEQIDQKKTVDLARFIKRCTARTTCHMLGIVENDESYEEMLLEVAELSDALTSMIKVSASGLTEKKKQKGKKIYREFSKIIEKYYALDGQHTSSIIYELKKRNFEFEDAKSLLVTLIMAGTETVSSGLPRMVAVLIDDDRWEELHNNPDDIDGAISEGLRFTAPSPLILHSTIKDSKIDRFSFKKNRRVLIMLLNIMRSPKYYDKPYEIDFKRTQNDQYRNFWFGAGPHFCIGSELAKKEIKAILETLIAQSKNPKIIKRRFARGTSFPGYKELIVDFSD